MAQEVVFLPTMCKTVGSIPIKQSKKGKKGHVIFIRWTWTQDYDH
jgi:hypothetical protein